MDRKHASDFPQDLLNLFDRYVHGEISRRDFFERAQKFAERQKKSPVVKSTRIMEVD